MKRLLSLLPLVVFLVSCSIPGTEEQHPITLAEFKAYMAERDSINTLTRAREDSTLLARQAAQNSKLLDQKIDSIIGRYFSIILLPEFSTPYEGEEEKTAVPRTYEQ